MTKKILITILSICLLSTIYADETSQYRLKTVVIDAGHGGKDPGAIGKISKEKNITLSIAKKTGQYIEEKIPDVKVIYTRETDTFIELHRRAEIANQANADLFISIHVNASANKNAVGTDSWVMGLHKNEGNLEVAKRENKVILIEEDYSQQYQGVDPNSSESYIIFNLMQNIYNEQSLQIAAKVQDQFENRVGRKSRGVETAPFFVLWNTAMPSVLIETGFITNEAEELFLNSEQGQDFMASAIFRAFRDYKNELEANSNFLPTNINDEILFSLQIASSKKHIETLPKNFQNVENVFEMNIDGTFKYLVGKDIDYNKIVQLKESLKSKYPDAFIIATQNGNRIPINEALNKK